MFGNSKHLKIIYAIDDLDNQSSTNSEGKGQDNYFSLLNRNTLSILTYKRASLELRGVTSYYKEKQD